MGMGMAGGRGGGGGGSRGGRSGPCDDLFDLLKLLLHGLAILLLSTCRWAASLLGCHQDEQDNWFFSDPLSERLFHIACSPFVVASVSGTLTSHTRGRGECASMP
eukprot:COSAG04_NODE_5_length_50521_cov_24.772639_3_plen_105_part_00